MKDPFARRLHGIYALYTLGVLGFVVLLGHLERSGWSRAWIGATFLIATVGVYAVVGLLSRTTDELEYFVAGRRVPAVYNGMATAADWMSAASFIGTAGVLYLQGQQGLAYVMGWTGGYCLVVLLLAPYLRRFGQYTIPDFLGERYGNGLPRLVGAAAAVLVSLVYLVVQIYGVGLITSHLTGFTFDLGIFVGLGGVLVCSFLGGMRAVTWTQVAQYIVLILAYAVPVVWLSVAQTGNPMPLVAYGQQMERVAGYERALASDPREAQVVDAYRQRAVQAAAKLADVPAAMAADERELAARIAQLQAEAAPLARIQALERKRSALPRNEAEARNAYTRERDEAEARVTKLSEQFGRASAYPAGSGAPEGGVDRNFVALVLCLMVGTAAMPHILMRSYTTRSAREARRSVAWSLLFIVLLYLMAPALATFVKHEVLSNVVGVHFDQMPFWLRRWAALDGGLISFEDVNGDGILQFAELDLSADMIVLAAPDIGRLPSVVTYLVAAGGLAAALSTADGLLLTIANALSHDVYYRVLNPQARPIRRVMLAKLMVLVVALLAAWLASLRVADIVPFVAAAFSLAAAAFFPALVLGVFWRRANAAGAVAGMAGGLVLCLWYMLANFASTRAALGLPPGTGGRWFDIDPIAAGVFAVPFGFAVIMVVSLCTAAPSAAQQGLVDRLRRPGPGPRPEAG